MTWPNTIGHDQIFDRFLRSYQNNRLANSYLFVGPDGIGKRLFALSLAKGFVLQSTGVQPGTVQHMPKLFAGCQAGTSPI